jgi:hypothetical protein
MPTIATTAELALLLDEDVEEERMALLLDLAEGLAKPIAGDPLPAAAKPVILAVAVRAFANPASTGQQGLGSGQVTFQAPGGLPVGGLYLSRTDKAALRRARSGGAAFTISLLPATLGGA